MLLLISVISKNEGVTGFCGMGMVFINYHMCAVNPGFLTIGQFTAYFGLKLSRSIAVLEEA